MSLYATDPGNAVDDTKNLVQVTENDAFSVIDMLSRYFGACENESILFSLRVKENKISEQVTRLLFCYCVYNPIIQIDGGIDPSSKIHNVKAKCF